MRRRCFAAAVCCIAACGDDPPAPRAPAAVPVEAPVVAETAAAPDSADLIIRSTRGSVEVRQDDEWRPAAPLDRLDDEDQLRTGEGGAATLALPGDGVLTLEEESSITLGPLASDVARIRLERGRLGAALDGDGAAIEVGAPGSPARAAAKRGNFRMFTDGVGVIAVATETGEVTLSAPAGAITIGPGEGAVVVGDETPEKRAVPSTVYLKVAWPEVDARATEVEVRGEAPVGSDLEVNGRHARAGADGSFAVVVPLADGANRVEVKATDLLGRSRSARRVFAIDRSPPKVEVAAPRWSQ
jgi:hypothetical protein